MAKITRTRLLVSSVALLLTAMMMMPTMTDARGSGDFDGHGALSSHLVASSSMSFAHRNASFNRSRRIGSHFFTLGVDGVWVDNSVSTPTMPTARQPMLLPQSATRLRAAMVKTPSAPRAGIILVRGDSMSYVTFPAPRRG